MKKFSQLVNESEVPSNLTFLGYHSSKRDLSGFESEIYRDGDFDRVRRVFLNSISRSVDGYSKALADRDKMLNKIEKLGIRVTFLSEEPIEGSYFQSSKYKYGDNLYEVYGKDWITLLEDYSELNAVMAVYYEDDPLYFKRYKK